MDKKEIAKNLIFTEIDLLRNAVIYEDIKANDFCNHSEDGKCKIFKCKCKVVDNTCSNYDNDKIIDEINNIISIFLNALKPTVLPIKCIDKKEMINHPSHYNQGKYEAIDVIEDWNLGFNLGNTVKYIARAGHKDKSKTIEDLKKSLWYLQREINRLEGENNGGN